MSIVNIKSKTDLSEFYLVYKVASHNEKEGFRGICHHIEHVMCEEMKKCEDAMTTDGVDFNAFTGENEVVFYIKGLERKLDKWRKVMIDSVINYAPTEDVVDREREIVLEEYKQYSSGPTEKHFWNVLRKHYNNYTAIGSEEEIKTFDHKKVTSYIKEHFSKPSFIVNVSKNKLKDNFGLKFSKEVSSFVPKNLKKNKFIVDPTNQQGDGAHMILVGKNPINENQGYLKVINAMLTMGLTSPFQSELRENRKLTYGAYVATYDLNSHGILLPYMPTSSSKLKSAEDGFKYVLNNHGKFMTKERFNLVKEYIKVGREKKNIFAEKNVFEILSGKEWAINPKDYNYDTMMDMYKKYYLFNKFDVSVDIVDFKG